jgi:phosphoribosylamine--glycine ligase
LTTALCTLGDSLARLAVTSRLGVGFTNGGRVLGVTALADDLAAARDLANAACEKIHFEGAFWRKVIGDRALARI